MYNGPKWVGYDSPERAKTKVSFGAGVLRNFLRTSYKLLKIFLTTYCELLKNSEELLNNVLRTSYELLKNFLIMS